MKIDCREPSCEGLGSMTRSMSAACRQPVDSISCCVTILQTTGNFRNCCVKAIQRSLYFMLVV
ncbi:hypothetical protein RchiOBHm_Chr5g0034121 [Rosa chinensis]|uniref:Uncharacterized protein n=1 Tax=Rosa chinensis TaxID=74649 RepID=A0A2P6QAV2_ROSCH|nr:hypothetical protein RchiOBHm_Chr5g0034121 [Rosa chinensis]